MTKTPKFRQNNRFEKKTDATSGQRICCAKNCTIIRCTISPYTASNTQQGMNYA